MMSNSVKGERKTETHAAHVLKMTKLLEDGARHQAA